MNCCATLSDKNREHWRKWNRIWAT